MGRWSWSEWLFAFEVEVRGGGGGGDVERELGLIVVARWEELFDAGAAAGAVFVELGDNLGGLGGEDLHLVVGAVQLGVELTVGDYRALRRCLAVGSGEMH